MNEREQYISGLRELAKFFEDTPDFPLPPSVSFNAWPEADAQGSKLADFGRLARLLGNARKKVTDSFFWLDRRFGPHTLSVVDYRGQICTRRVVGKKTVTERVPVAFEERTTEQDVVEWDCPSVLAKTQ